MHRLSLGLAPDVPVTWGEGTQDEMCLASLQMVDRLPWEAAAICATAARSVS